ncbi:GGDEF domain-containing protein [Mycolicibacterium sediminis]|uniref:GGDEF domain-containing protein n=1 Tax=Mycolicibacterium sediminis TaxID=1286180 RepID=A0A7I7QKZ5_9MYCO|nr:GGDEF domain-containing protein [Mycolicibacterium sediminis]BBY26944.1 hypothetical protein MSEDJ_10400 [Mycolicibacterium sediminis]
MTLVEVPERFIRRTTALLVLCIGAIGLVTTFTAEGPHPGWQRVVVTAVCASTIPVGLFVAWTPLHLRWRRQLSRRGQLFTVAFVVYADVGIGAVLLTFADREGALYGTALFAVVGVYAGYFAPRRYVTAHVVGTSVFITVMAWLTWRQGQHDAAGVLARWMVSMLSANCALGILRNFTSRVQDALDAQFEDATHDPLTGLLNRRGLDSWAERALDPAMRPVGFVILDLDNFKSINDEYGHEAGDRVLVLVASRLRNTLGDDATIARTGGEEFALVLAADLDHCTRVAHAVRVALHDEDDDIPVTVSAGVSALATTETGHRDPVDALKDGLRRADVAMFEAKDAGRNQVRAFPG